MEIRFECKNKHHLDCCCGFPSADEDHGEGQWHLQRGQAHRGGWAVAWLSAWGVLQPGGNTGSDITAELCCSTIDGVVCWPCPTERHGESQRSSRHSLHGSGQSVQTLVPDGFHQLPAAPALHRTYQTFPLSGGKASYLTIYTKLTNVSNPRIKFRF